MNRPILFLIGITIAILSTCIHADSSAVTDSSNWITAFTTRPEVASQEDLCNKLVDSLSGKSDIRELLDLENFQLTFPTTADIIPQSGPGYFGEDGLKLFGQRLNALIEIKDSTISLLGADEVKQTCHVNVQLSFKVKATDLESPEGTSVVIVAQSWQDKFVAARLNFPSTQVYNHVSAVFLTEPQLHLKALAQGIYHFGYDSPCLAKTFFDKNSQITIDTPFGNLKFSGNTAISRAIDWISWHIHGRHHKRNNNGIEEFFRSLLLGDDSSNDNKYVSTIVNPERDSELLKKIEQTDEDECSNVQANDALATSIFSNDLMSTISSNMEYLRRGILGDSNNDIKSTIIDNNNQCHRDHFRSGTLPLLLPFVHFCDHVWTEDKQTVYDCFVPPITEKSRHFIPHRALHWLYLHGMTVRVTVDWTDDWKIGQINYTPMQQLGYVHGDWHSHAEPDSHHDQDHHDDHHDHHPHRHEEESSSKPVPPPSPHRPGFLNRRPRF